MAFWKYFSNNNQSTENFWLLCDFMSSLELDKKDVISKEP